MINTSNNHKGLLLNWSSKVCQYNLETSKFKLEIRNILFCKGGKRHSMLYITTTSFLFTSLIKKPISMVIHCGFNN